MNRSKVNNIVNMKQAITLWPNEAKQTEKNYQASAPGLAAIWAAVGEN